MRQRGRQATSPSFPCPPIQFPVPCRLPSGGLYQPTVGTGSALAQGYARHAPAPWARRRQRGERSRGTVVAIPCPCSFRVQPGGSLSSRKRRLLPELPADPGSGVCSCRRVSSWSFVVPSMLFRLIFGSRPVGRRQKPIPLRTAVFPYARWHGCAFVGEYLGT
jgi:hypothetical protein